MKRALILSLLGFTLAQGQDGVAPAPSVAVEDSGRGNLPPAVATLDAQFRKIRAERVTQPFEGGMAGLKNNYLQAIRRKIEEEKAGGRLDGTLAWETELQRVTAGEKVANSGGGKPEDVAVAALRTVYVGACDKLAAQRDAQLKALTEPLDQRLAQMEAEFTKGDRLADAKAVRGYRERLTRGAPPSTQSPAAGLAATSSAKGGRVNTLGMEFVPVPGTDVLFCVHETRRGDYAAYAAETPDADTAWKDQRFSGVPSGDKDDHPVVGVSWDDAQAFCVWLSRKEGKKYRLPTDEEWSYAVGLGKDERRTKDTTPETLNSKIREVFPWDGGYPPKDKSGAGNYADSTWREKFPTELSIDGYTDGFVTTAPVKSFKPNKFGIHDLGGNAWEWVADWYNPAQQGRVVRGVSFYYQGSAYLVSSARTRLPPTKRVADGGFRCVLEP